MYTSNIFAILSLRALYGFVNTVLGELRFLGPAVALVRILLLGQPASAQRAAAVDRRNDSKLLASAPSVEHVDVQILQSCRQLYLPACVALLDMGCLARLSRGFMTPADYLDSLEGTALLADRFCRSVFLHSLQLCKLLHECSCVGGDIL